MVRTRIGVGRLGAALFMAAAALLFAAPAMSQGNPPVFNNAPTFALPFPSICSTESFSFGFALGNVMNHTDGTLDLVMICGQNIVTIPGNGDGTFATASAVRTTLSSSFSNQISHFSLAYIDGGAKLDLVATDFECNVDVFLGTGPGTFSSTPTQISEGISSCNTSTAPGPIFVADFNGDGKPDIAIQNSRSGPPSIIVLINQSAVGDVSFSAPISLGLGIPANSATQQFGGMAIGNFTGQSVPDLAVVTGTFVSGAGFTNTMYVLKNNGLGTAFAEQQSVTLPKTLYTGTLVGLVAANLSSDGFVDVAAADTDDGAIFILYGHGTGNLTSCSAPGSPSSIASCQSSDGQTITGLPLIFANNLLVGNFSGPSGPPGLLFASANECMSVLLGATGGGLQTTPTTYVVGNSVTSVVAGDVNNDGYTDAIAAWNNGLSVFLNNTGGTLEGTQAFIAGAAPGEISLLQNFFGNDEQDLAVIPINSGITGSAAAVTVFGAPASGPNGTLPQSSGPIPVPPGQSITAMTSGCVLANSSPCATPFVAFATYESAINRAFGFAFTTATGGAATDIGGALSTQQITAIAAGDFNGDGNTDLAFAIGSTNTILVFTGSGNGTFSSTPLTISLGAGHNPVALAVANFKGTGLPDIAVLNQTTNSVGILLNNTSNSVDATLSFAAMASYPTGLSFPVGFTVGDFNGDTKPDIAVVSGPAIAILLNQGGGVFPATAPTPITIPLPPSTSFASAAAIATGDFNGDGILDLAVALPQNPDNVEILNGIGNGTFATATPTFWSVGANPAAMVVANFKGLNGDGMPDIAVADGDPEGNTVALLLNGTAAANAPPPTSPAFAQFSISGVPNAGPIDFGAVQVNTTGTQQLTLTNTGTSSFMVNGISLQDASSAFSITNVVCNGTTLVAPYSSMSVTLGADQTCTISLQFLPTLDQNAYAGDLVIATTATNSNAAAGPGGTGQAILLLGDGVEPYANYSQTQVSFGNENENTPATQTVTVTNMGDGPLTIDLVLPGGQANGFSVPQFICSNGVSSASSSPYPITLSPASPAPSCTYTVQFDPTTTGPLSGTLGFTDNAGVGESNLTSTSINGTTFQQTVPLSGTGVVVGPTLTSIQVSPSNPTIALNGSQQFTAVGTFSDGSMTNPLTGVTWSVTNATPSGVATIDSGTGLATAGASAGSATIAAAVGGISGSTTLTVAVLVGPDTETITVTDFATVTPLISVSAPVVSFSTNSLGFGSVAAGTSGTETITVSNIGEGQTGLTLASAVIPSGTPFSLGPIVCSNGDSSLPATIPSGGGCLISVTYQAPASGTANATLTFTDNAALSNLTSTLLSGSNYTQTISLIGNGTTSAAPPPPPATVDVTDNETITVTDSPQAQASGCPAITVSPLGTLTPATIGVAYSQQFSASGGATPLGWSTTSAPSWLIIAPTTGLLSGTPTATGTFPFSVTATDKNTCTGSASVSLTVAPKPTATTTAITMTTSSDNGNALPANTALIENPITVSFTVQPSSGGATATGAIKVTDGVSANDGCSAMLSGGASSCVMTISPTASASTPLTAAYTPDTTATGLGLLASTSAAFTETITEIDNCGTLPAAQTVTQGAASSFTFSVCLAANVQAAATAAVTGCPPSAQCSDTVTPVAGEPGVYTIAVTITTGAAGRNVPTEDRWPWNRPRPFALFGLGLLLATLMALRMAQQNRERARLAYGAGLLVALLLVVSGISGCVRSGANNTGTPPNTYTVDVTIMAGNISIQVPLNVTVTK